MRAALKKEEAERPWLALILAADRPAYLIICINHTHLPYRFPLGVIHSAGVQQNRKGLLIQRKSIMELPHERRLPSASTDLFSATRPAYWHRQYAPWYWLLYAIGAIQLTAVILIGGAPASWILLASGITVGLLASSFHHLTVEDRGERLSVRFGPSPLFSMSIPYSDMLSVEAGRTSFLDGWGIHYSLRSGWIWNVWGRDCVVIQRRQSIMRIGSDDAENLLRFIRTRIRPRSKDSNDCQAQTDELGL